MSDYVISVRNIRKGEFGTEPGKTRFLSVPSNRIHVPAHEIRRNAFVEKVMTQATEDTDPITGDDRGDILVYVHGYNNSRKAVIARHRLLKKQLTTTGYRGALISFDWPSNDVALNYLEDRSDARKTSIRLVDDCIRLFATQQMRGCSFNVHLLAHSTGAYVIREGFDDADDRRHIAHVNWSVSQLVLISADVSAKSMGADDSKSSSIYRHCVRLTNYQNPFDSVLKLSNIKRVGVAPRVGRIGLPDDAPQKSVNVNTGAHYRKQREPESSLGAWDHSWHFYSKGFAKDLALTLRGDIDRQYLDTREPGPNGGLQLKP